MYMYMDMCMYMFICIHIYIYTYPYVEVKNVHSCVSCMQARRFALGAPSYNMPQHPILITKALYSFSWFLSTGSHRSVPDIHHGILSVFSKDDGPQGVGSARVEVGLIVTPEGPYTLLLWN